MSLACRLRYDLGRLSRKQCGSKEACQEHLCHSLLQCLQQAPTRWLLGSQPQHTRSGALLGLAHSAVSVPASAADGQLHKCMLAHERLGCCRGSSQCPVSDTGRGVLHASYLAQPLGLQQLLAPRHVCMHCTAGDGRTVAAAGAAELLLCRRLWCACRAGHAGARQQRHALQSARRAGARAGPTHCRPG